MQGQETIIPFISCLLDRSCPEAVFRSIGAMIVAAFNGVLWSWPSTHISIEASKIMPGLTYRNATSSIPGIGGVSWVFTATKHMRPDAMLRERGFAMHRLELLRRFSPQTST
jgi:hypothetical protein